MADTEPTTDDLLRSELLRLDIQLRKKQAWWETPRNAAIILGVFVALVGASAGVIGYKIGTAPPQPIVVQFGGAPLQVHIDQDKQP